uniref:Secreted protein n=2 Tax=Steinernema glaseri TaxID=37863 RepID=A0A1I8AVK7_9BILA
MKIFLLLVTNTATSVLVMFAKTTLVHLLLLVAVGTTLTSTVLAADDWCTQICEWPFICMHLFGRWDCFPMSWTKFLEEKSKTPLLDPGKTA